MMDFRNRTLSGVLALGIALYAGAPCALAAACPWQNDVAACTRWEALMKRLEAAAERAEAAASRLEGMATTAPPAGTPAAPGPQEAQVRAVIDGLLRYLTPPLPEAGGFEIDRHYSLAKQDDRYTAMFAKAAWVVGTNRVNFGPLTFAVQPQEQGLSQVRFRFGDVITLYEGDRVMTRLLIGEQDNQGTWDAALNNFAEARWRLANITLVTPEQPLILEIAAINAGQGLARKPDDTWNSRGNLQLTDLTVRTAQQTLHLADLTGQFSLDGRNYARFASLDTLFKNLFQQNLEGNEAEQKAMAALGEWYDLFSRSDLSLTATDLTVGEGQQPSARIGRLTFGSHFDEGEGSGSRQSYRIELKDLKTPPSEAPAHLLPTEVSLEFGLFNVPPKLMTRLMEIGMAADKLPEPEREAYWQQRFSELFLSSRMGLYIKDSSIRAPQAQLALNFQATADPQAALGGTGELILRAEGLQKLLESSQAALAGQGGAGFLAMLVALSERTEEAGKVIDNFRLKLTPEGKLLLNGKDITALLAPPQSPDQPTPPQAPPAQKRP